MRVVVDDVAFWAELLDQLCGDVDYAEYDLRVANEVGDEDAVATASAALKNARELRDTELPAIAATIQACCESSLMAIMPGFKNTVFARGSENALRAVLNRVEERHRAAASKGWGPMLEILAEIRATDYLPAEGSS